MLGLFFAQLLKSYGPFSGLGVEIVLSLRHGEKTFFLGENK